MQRFQTHMLGSPIITGFINVLIFGAQNTLNFSKHFLIIFLNNFFFFEVEFQPITSALDNYPLLSDQDINWFLM